MLKRKSKNKDRKVSKSQLIIVGSLLIVVGIGIVGGKYTIIFKIKMKKI